MAPTGRLYEQAAGFSVVSAATRKYDTVDALRAATSQPYFQESIRRSIEEHGVTAPRGIYRVAVEITAP
jgi:hypothetical protein